MHTGVLDFVRRVSDLVPPGAAVLEIGAYNVNGTPYTALADRCAEYWGLDRRPGSGVSIVATAGLFDGMGRFDAVVSTETLEHADPAEVLGCAWRALRPGGALILTAAAPERRPHGIDGGPLAPGEYYRAVQEDELREQLIARGWTEIYIEHHADRGDLYATAVKP